MEFPSYSRSHVARKPPPNPLQYFSNRQTSVAYESIGQNEVTVTSHVRTHTAQYSALVQIYEQKRRHIPITLSLAPQNKLTATSTAFAQDCKMERRCPFTRVFLTVPDTRHMIHFMKCPHT